jgi:biopolymer transport protein ExbD
MNESVIIEPRDDPEADVLPDPLPQRGHARLTLNLTSMIDVVFLLLIYFMVATEFKAGEEIYRLDLPDRLSAAQQQDPFDLDDEPLRISVASTGAGRSACRLRIDGPYPQPADFDDLHSFLAQRQIGPGNAAGLFRPNHPIIIVPLGEARWDHAVETLNSAVRARYTNVMFGRRD